MQTIHFNHHHSFVHVHVYTHVHVCMRDTKGDQKLKNLFGFRIFAYFYYSSQSQSCVQCICIPTRMNISFIFINVSNCVWIVEVHVHHIHTVHISIGGVGKWALIGQFTTLNVCPIRGTYTDKKGRDLLSFSQFCMLDQLQASVLITRVCLCLLFSIYGCNCVWKSFQSWEGYSHVWFLNPIHTGVSEKSGFCRWWWVWKWLKDGN